MGAKSQTMFNGVQTGRVGAIVGYKRDDSNAPQGIRPYVQPANPKTYAQSVQRAKFAGISVFISMCARISDHNIEGTKVGLKNRAAWQRILFSYLNGPLSAAKGAQVVAVRNNVSNAQVPVSRGSLGRVAISGGTAPGADITLTADNMAGYGLKEGDIITILTGNVQDGHLASINFEQVEVKVGAVLPVASWSHSGNTYTIKMVESCVALIIERDGESSHLLTTSGMVGIPVWTADQQEEIIKTYMAASSSLSNNRYLYGSEFAGTQAPVSTGGTTGGSSSGSGGGLPDDLGE